MSERGTTTAKILAGEICCACKSVLPSPHKLEHQHCALCSPPRRKVYMHFMLTGGWYCQFLEADLKTPLPRKLTFATADKVRELVERGGGIRSTEDRQAFEYAPTIGRGGVHLALTEEQYAKLTNRRTSDRKSSI